MFIILYYFVIVLGSFIKDSGFVWPRSCSRNGGASGRFVKGFGLRFVRFGSRFGML